MKSLDTFLYWGVFRNIADKDFERITDGDVDYQATNIRAVSNWHNICNLFRDI